MDAHELLNMIVAYNDAKRRYAEEQATISLLGRHEVYNNENSYVNQLSEEVCELAERLGSIGRQLAEWQAIFWNETDFARFANDDQLAILTGGIARDFDHYLLHVVIPSVLVKYPGVGKYRINELGEVVEVDTDLPF